MMHVGVPAADQHLVTAPGVGGAHAPALLGSNSLSTALSSPSRNMHGQPVDRDQAQRTVCVQ